MKLTRLFKASLVLWATLGMCLPQALFAAQTSPVTNITDVTLGNGGVLLGQVVNETGAPQANTVVSLQSGQQEIGAGKTDGGGYFAFSGLRGGVYQVVVAGGQGAYRVWTSGSAPPSAQQAALVVAGPQNGTVGQQPDLVRGQYGGRLGFWLSNPWVIAGVVATAIAVPVAVVSANHHHHSQPVSP
jgi:hypothetical protein